MKTEVKVSLPRAEIRQRVDIPLYGGQGTFFTFKGLADGREHLVIGLGPWESQISPMVRMHSECLTGDVFGSRRCDCGEQLEQSIKEFQVTGGLIIYLRQEGRGIGLYNKLDTYVLQLQGLDTYEANKALGFDADLRDYTVAAQMLKVIGRDRIKLLSNNPDKAAQLRALGVDIAERVSTGVFLNRMNKRYLEAKVLKTGHFIKLNGEKQKCGS
jgi:GTP cyclohydrolase II